MMNRKIIEVLDSIDWNAVHELYATNRWKWYCRPSIIPSAKELREGAESVVETAFARSGWRDVMCGRIYSNVSDGVLEIYFGSSRNKQLRHLFVLSGSDGIKGIEMKTQEDMREWLRADCLRKITPRYHVSGWNVDLYYDCWHVTFGQGKSIEEAFSVAETGFYSILKHMIEAEIERAKKERDELIIYHENKIKNLMGWHKT